jgi:8-oxo-dGTP pyrophosphatase MutT (NUDIX family)
MKEIVNIIVIVNKKYFLLTRIREGDVWTFPGGKVEDGESKKKAVIRESGEELPKVKILKLIPYKVFEGITPHSKTEARVSTFFAGITGEIEPGAEIKETIFSDINFLKKINLTAISKKIIESLLKDGYLIK